MKKTMKDLTDHPKLFSVYWGNFLTDDKTVNDPRIIENRNNFVKEFDIVKLDTSKSIYNVLYPTVGDEYEHDHGEVYRTKDGGVVLLYHNYNRKPKLKMEEYKKMYSIHAKTYVATFKTIKDCTAALRAVNI